MNKFERGQQPCWTCANSCGSCSWSSQFIPVEGWKAIPSVIHRTHIVETYKIESCPLYLYDGLCSRCRLCPKEERRNPDWGDKCPHRKICGNNCASYVNILWREEYGLENLS